MKTSLLAALSGSLILIGVQGCALIRGENPDSAYKDAQTGTDLVLPPDISAGGVKKPRVTIPPGNTATGECEPCELAAVQPAQLDPAASSQPVDPVVPRLNGATLVRSQAGSWLALDATPEQTWAGLQEFVASQGLVVASASPLKGLIETDWIDNAAALQSPGLSEVLQAGIAPESLGLHRFTLRLERTPEDMSRLFVRHEALQNDSAQTALNVDDPEISARMLTDLLVFFGLDKNNAQSVLAN